MATKIQYPEWVEKYRTKGCTIRKVRDGYGLYKCTSVSSPDLPYPKSKQEYLGMVTEKDGFIPKRSTAAHPIFIEYGLSRLIWINFKRTLLRSSFNGSENLIRLGIVYFIFGSVNENLLRYTFIADGHETEIGHIDMGLQKVWFEAKFEDAEMVVIPRYIAEHKVPLKAKYEIRSEEHTSELQSR